MQKITPCLWFDGNAQEAMDFYTGIFPESKVVDSSTYGEAGPGAAGSLVAATFELLGQRFMVLNGGPQFNFTEAISFMVTCEDQEKVDHYWDRLVDGGQPSRCGWLKDKFGVSWQIVPSVLGEYLGDPDRQKANRVMEAMLQMVKLDIETLKKARDQ